MEPKKEEINKMEKLYNEIRELKMFAGQALEAVILIHKELLGKDDLPEKWTTSKVNYGGGIEEMTCAMQHINQIVKNTFSVASTILQEVELDC